MISNEIKGGSIGFDPRMIQIQDLPEPNQNSFDEKLFKEAICEQKGKRSLRQFACDVDLSESFVSKAVTGQIHRAPSKRTIIKLINDELASSVKWRQILTSSGYHFNELDFDQITDREEKKERFSEIAEISHTSATDLFLSCGILMSMISRTTNRNNLSSRVYYDAGYFEIVDESGKSYLGLNCCVLDKNDYKSAFPLMTTACIMYEKLCNHVDVQDKTVYLITNTEVVFNVLCGSPLSMNTMATIVLCLDDNNVVKKEKILHGTITGLKP